MKKYLLKNNTVYGLLIEIYCYAETKKQAIQVFSYILDKLVTTLDIRCVIEKTEERVIANMERVKE